MDMVPETFYRESSNLEPMDTGSRRNSKSDHMPSPNDEYPSENQVSSSRPPTDREHSGSKDRGRERDYHSSRHRERSRSSRRHHSRSRSPRYRDDYREYRGSRGYDDRYDDRYDRDGRSGRSSRDYRSHRTRSRSPRGYHGHRRRRSPSPPTDDATCDRRTVFVMQLSARVQSIELEKFFSQAGKVRAARIIEDRNTRRSKGVGYVEFYDEESVAKAIALTGQKILGIPVIAKHTESEKNRLALVAAEQQKAEVVEKPPKAVDSSQRRLYIGSVNFDLTEDDLKQVLEPFGPIEFVNLHRDMETGKSKGFAFVQYKNAEDAVQALLRMNGFELAGRTIKVGLVPDKNLQTAQVNNNFRNQNQDGHINHSIHIDDSDTAGYAMTSQSRADLMQKLARGDASLGAIQPPVHTPPPVISSYVAPKQLPVVMPSRAILLKNMFSDQDKEEENWARELEEDVKEEAEKFGPVVHIQVEQASTQGEIFLKFDTVQSATAAVQALGGRFFAGAQIVAAYLPELLYNARFPAAAQL